MTPTATSPVERLRTRLEKVRPSGDGFTARCPAHDDGSPSLSFSEGADGRALLNCHAGCDTEEVVRSLGWEMSDLYPENGAPTERRNFTAADYADYVGVPEDFLRSEFGVRTEREPGKPATVGIPYRAQDGSTIRTRRRTRDRFWWDSDGDGVSLYGLDRLADADLDRAVLLVEGESDVHAVAFHDVLAVGVPGASSWRPSWACHLEGRDVYVWREPDQGGEQLVRDVAEDLPDAGVLEAPEAAEDPAALHEAAGEEFRERLQAMTEQARSIQEAEATAATVASGDERPAMSDLMDEIGATDLGDIPRYEARRKVLDRWVASLRGVGRRRMLGERNELVRLHGLPANEVDAALDERWDEGRGTPELEPDDDASEELQEEADELLLQPDLTDRAYEAMTRRGLVGEEVNAKVLLLAGVGGCVGDPVHVAVLGESSAGKNELGRRVSELLPPHLVHPVTGLSTHALEYRGGSVDGMLVIQEARGQDDAEYQLREAMSEGRVTRWTVDEGDDGMEARELEVEVNASVVTTTTRASLHPENATRVFTLEVDSSPAQTRAVLDEIGRRAEDHPSGEGAEREIRVWRRALSQLEHRTVRVPYARRLTEALPDRTPRARRDAKRTLTLLRVHALLHQRQRPEDDEGYLLATAEDYAAVYPLLDEVLEPSISGLTDTAREIVSLHRELAEDAPGRWVKRADLEREAGKRDVASPKTVRKWAKQLNREGIWKGERRERNAWWHKQTHDVDAGAVNLPVPEALDGGNPGSTWESGGTRSEARESGENGHGGKGGSETPGDTDTGGGHESGRETTNRTREADHPGDHRDDDLETPDYQPLPPLPPSEDAADADDEPEMEGF